MHLTIYMNQSGIFHIQSFDFKTGTQVNVTLAAKPPQPHKNCQLETEQTIKQNRKLPITRKDDFLLEI
jgi:hypothetical protein